MRKPVVKPLNAGDTVYRLTRRGVSEHVVVDVWKHIVSIRINHGIVKLNRYLVDGEKARNSSDTYRTHTFYRNRSHPDLEPYPTNQQRDQINGLLAKLRYEVRNKTTQSRLAVIYRMLNQLVNT
ncbi:hypothetical protein GCM10028806_33840 [Spirosoma terrae]|uniref:Uncharacterized protein n=1 Tax=Spirosoma terrae TaxID=1968276 RepID=A0A6L9L568_9BACT|nr:hypothetical protein [Spirosoma terrae]NDU95696.1 hypothetical protein [Spirosoma terrae]